MKKKKKKFEMSSFERRAWVFTFKFMHFADRSSSLYTFIYLTLFHSFASQFIGKIMFRKTNRCFIVEWTLAIESFFIARTSSCSNHLQAPFQGKYSLSIQNNMPHEKKKKKREKDGENITSFMYNSMDDLWHCQRHRVSLKILTYFIFLGRNIWRLRKYYLITVNAEAHCVVITVNRRKKNVLSTLSK